MIKGIIYKATNKVNGKCYIGQTIFTLENRIASHCSSASCFTDNYYFHNALRKYGKDNFKWEIIEHCDSKEEMDEMEFNYIKQFNSFMHSGYNMTFGGEGTLGHTHSEETKDVISKALKGKYVGRSNHFYGKKHTEETRKKMSETHKGKLLAVPFSEEHKRKISIAMKGKKKSPEHIRNISETRRKNNTCVGSNSKQAVKYVIITPEGDRFMVHGIADFCRNYKKHSVNFRNLTAVARGERRHHKQYKCEYYDPIKHKDIEEYIHARLT